MKQVVLHIGMHKTGTTSVQSALSGYARRGVKYASFSEVNHSVPMHTIFSESRADYHVWKRRGFSPIQIEEERKKYLKILEDDVKDRSCSRLIISGEDIGTLMPSDQSAIVQWFQDRRVDLKILALVRSPIAYASSVAQEIIRGGSTEIPLVRPHYKSRLDTFSKLLPVGSVVVGSYDDLSSSGRLFSFFEKQLGVTLPRNARLNQSRSLQAILLTHLLNNSGLELQGTLEKQLAREKLLSLIDSVFSIENGCSNCSGLLSRCLDSDNAQKEATWLFKKFDIDFRDLCGKFRGLTSNDIDVNSYFHQHQSKLVQMFETRGMKYSSNQSISSQLIRIYTSILRECVSEHSAYLIRDIALQIHKDPSKLGLKDALELMKVAGNLRPGGPFIQKKIAEWTRRC